MLRAALAGRRYSSKAAAAQAALTRAASARARGDCASASAAAYEAVFDLAAAQAAGIGAHVTEALERAYSTVLVCADARGDSATAARAASRIRALGPDVRPPSVPAPVWSRYPAIDATLGVKWMKLVVDTDPAGATVWIDHARVGAAPVTTYVTEGPHVVGAGRNGACASRRVHVTGATSVSLSLDLPPIRWMGVRLRVAGLRGHGAPSPTEISALLLRTGARVAVVLAGAQGGAALWAIEDSSEPARRLGPVPDGATAAAVVSERVRAWHVREALARASVAPRAPALDLAHPSSAPGRAHAHAGGTPWWAYVAIAGAVALGAGVAAAAKLSHDTQRIELSWP